MVVKAPGTTASRLVDAATVMMMRGGYAGFSYADLAGQIGIRKASIHHHFPSKVDLVVAAVEQARAAIRGQIAALDETTCVAMDQLRLYTGYWERCIRDQTAPFCLAAVLAAELPNLPAKVGTAVRGHFDDLSTWLARVLALGVEQGSMALQGSLGAEAEIFMATTYGAMLAARAYDDPARFAKIVEASIDRIRA